MQYITTWPCNKINFFNIAKEFSSEEGTVCFSSQDFMGEDSYFFLCLFPEKKIVVPLVKNSWDILKANLELSGDDKNLPEWVGYISFEMGLISYGCYSGNYSSKIPGATFYCPRVILRFNEKIETVEVFSKNSDEGVRKFFKKTCRNHFEFVKGKASIKHRTDTLESYVKKVKKIQDCILNGDVYQVCLSQQFTFLLSVDVLSHACNYFFHLFLNNPNKHAVFFKGKEFAIVCNSPESLLSKKGNVLQTRPIKGTRPRRNNHQEDNLERKYLLSSEKEKSELLMITDLMRNDLGKISILGSLEVKTLLGCLENKDVFHLFSLIESRVNSSVHVIDILKGLIPGGSVSGCPKISALKIIREEEQHNREIYTGSIGYITGTGDMEFNIAIRTALFRKDEVVLASGGAVTIESSPEEEYKETLYKVREFFRLLSSKYEKEELLI